MKTLTVPPFLLAFLVGLANMTPQPIYRVCRRGVGTIRIDAFREKASTWRTAYRRALGAWKAMFLRWAPTLAVLLLVALIAHAAEAAHPGSGATFAAAPILVARQMKANLEKDIHGLKAEARKLMEVPSATRTAEQSARLDAIDASLTAKSDELTPVLADIARLERYQADERGSDTGIEVGTDRATLKPWAPSVSADASPLVKAEVRHLALGNFAMAVRAAAYGTVDPRLQAVATGAGTQSDSNLGFAVPQDVAPGIEREMYTQGEILSRVDARPITGNNMTYTVVDETSRVDGSRGGGILGYWVDEGVAPTISNTKFAKMELKLRKVGALGVMTDELLSDAIALGGELEQGFADELIFQVENKVYRGNGASAPLGFLNAPCLVTITKEAGRTSTVNPVVTTNISKMWARMPSRSKKNSVWLYNTELNPYLDELAQVIGTGGTAPRFVSYDEAGVLRIKGRPAIEVEYAEAAGTVGDFALVDFAKYRIIRKGGVEQASSMHVYFATGEQAFRAFYRVDGQPTPRAPITPFKGTATLSPFVVLGTR